MISLIIPTYNASNAALQTVSSLAPLIEDRPGQAEIILVDDGSSEAERELLRGWRQPYLKVVESETNRGRGAAINSGARAAGGEYLAFLDCDCRPQVGAFLDEHLETLNRGNDVSVGPITTTGTGFWARYQHAAADRRARQFAAGRVFAMTSANMMVKRQWFDRVGGFDTRYRGYGFEDRDLLMRLFEAGARIGGTEAAVYHEADLDLPAVVRKMAEAGRTTAPLFRQTHPGAYRELGYAAIDATLKPWLALPAHVSGRLAEMGAPLIERQIERLPFAVAAGIVKLASAMAFMSGTAATR